MHFYTSATKVLEIKEIDPCFVSRKCCRFRLVIWQRGRPEPRGPLSDSVNDCMEKRKVKTIKGLSPEVGWTLQQPREGRTYLI